MNFMAEDVGNHQFLDQSWLEQILVPVLSRDFLCLTDIVDNLADVVHELAQKLSALPFVVEEAS
jgi:uncharacterized protein Yka (UPF0111/DUF47 family)